MWEVIGSDRVGTNKAGTPVTTGAAISTTNMHFDLDVLVMVILIISVYERVNLKSFKLFSIHILALALVKVKPLEN